MPNQDQKQWFSIASRRCWERARSLLWMLLSNLFQKGGLTTAKLL